MMGIVLLMSTLAALFQFPCWYDYNCGCPFLEWNKKNSNTACLWCFWSSPPWLHNGCCQPSSHCLWSQRMPGPGSFCRSSSACCCSSIWTQSKCFSDLLFSRCITFMVMHQGVEWNLCTSTTSTSSILCSLPVDACLPERCGLFLKGSPSTFGQRRPSNAVTAFLVSCLFQCCSSVLHFSRWLFVNLYLKFTL